MGKLETKIPMTWRTTLSVFVLGSLLAACATAPIVTGEKPMSDVTKINYIEFPVTDMASTKQFYTDAFGWEYVDYGPTYSSFSNAGIDGGFDAESGKKPMAEGALVVMYAPDIEACLKRVTNAGGKIVKPIFDFPGGRRFHFLDPNGNELAVWSEPVQTE